MAIYLSAARSIVVRTVRKGPARLGCRGRAEESWEAQTGNFGVFPLRTRWEEHTGAEISQGAG